jgi:hypothetical protein
MILWIVFGTFVICGVMVALLLYLIMHSRTKASEIISRLDEHHVTSKKELARMNAEVHVTKSLTDEIHEIARQLHQPQQPNELAEFLKTNKLK